MKFGKELQAQQVPEWQNAYMNYNFLKKLLKDVIHFKQQQQQHKPAGLARRASLYRAFSGLTCRGNEVSDTDDDEEEDKAILVSEIQDRGCGGGRSYQTMFLRSSDEGGEVELLFFKALDDELNKVVRFHKAKLDQILNEAQELSRQMDALIALRAKVDNPLSASSTVTDSNARRSGRVHMDVIQEVELGGVEGAEDHVKINIAPDAPLPTSKVIVLDSKLVLSYNEGGLRRAEQVMSHAFIEFHKRLRLLKSYSFLNILAFSKIMKKYDKITSRSAGKDYMEMVEKSDLGSSGKITRLMERVESTFIKHFSNGNRRKGMKTLRPTSIRERHRVSWFSGTN